MSVQNSRNFYTHVSIRHLKAVHTATHPGRLATVGQHDTEGLEAVEDDLVALLDGEGEKETR